MSILNAVPYPSQGIVSLPFFVYIGNRLCREIFPRIREILVDPAGGWILVEIFQRKIGIPERESQ
jgi:hypothetical protein